MSTSEEQIAEMERDAILFAREYGDWPQHIRVAGNVRTLAAECRRLREQRDEARGLFMDEQKRKRAAQSRADRYRNALARAVELLRTCRAIIDNVEQAPNTAEAIRAFLLSDFGTDEQPDARGHAQAGTTGHEGIEPAEADRVAGPGDGAAPPSSHRR